ncbi:MAG: class I SAM-dependent methyltransferase [Methanobacteriota archaeon]
MDPADSWERTYRAAPVTQLPWYTADLDPDIAKGLRDYGPRAGRILDLGTGPGTHAVGLAKLGYEVTATDISRTAIESARSHARSSGVVIDFRVDNVLKSKLEDGAFAAVVDRGMFHVLPPEVRPRYVATVHRILRPRGLLHVKTFSDKEPGDWGPYRLSPDELRSYFSDFFNLVALKETVFQGVVRPPPRALFAAFRWRRRADERS